MCEYEYENKKLKCQELTQLSDIEMSRESVEVAELRELDLAANNIQFLNFENFKFKNLQSLNISDNFLLNLCEKTFKNGKISSTHTRGRTPITAD